MLATYAMMIKTLKQQIKELDKAIEALLEVIPESQLPSEHTGYWSTYCAIILAEISQIDVLRPS